MCDLQTIQYFYCNMKINRFGSHCHSALSPGAGGVACLAWWLALVQVGESSCLHYLGELSLKASLALKSFAA